MLFKMVSDNFTAWVYGPPLKCAQTFGMPEDAENCFQQVTKMAFDYGAVISPTTEMYKYWARNGYNITRHMNCTKGANTTVTRANEDMFHKGEDGNRGYREHMVDAWILKSGMMTTSCIHEWFFYGVPTAPNPGLTGQQRNSILYHPGKLWPNHQDDDSTTVHGPILIECPTQANRP